MTSEELSNESILCDKCHSKMKLVIHDSDNDEMVIGSSLVCSKCGRSVSC